MPDIIQLLPDNIANQIAAGEVIQRPASAVKELLENAVDAEATEIRLFIQDAGKQLIQVVDNGKGMSETDARMAFERHATSKIRNIDDLFHIRTMGFRGEALASIAAVAQVELKTRRPGDETGTCIEIENSRVIRQEPAALPTGSSIAMKNLFFNVPARRNFLKSNPAEMRHIVDEFIRVSLAFPSIFFSLTSNGQEVMHLEKGSLKQRIVQILGSSQAPRLVSVQENTDYLNIYGFVGKPETAKKTRGDQYFFVNNRFIRSAYLNHAVMSAYKDMIPQESYPLYVLFIDLDPEQVDINVHPTKQEIKFEDEKIVYAFVQAAVKHALAQFSVTPTLDFDLDPSIQRLDAVNKPVTDEKKAEVASSSLYQTFTKKNQAHFIEPTNKSELRHWKDFYEGPAHSTPAQGRLNTGDRDLGALAGDIQKGSSQPGERQTGGRPMTGAAAAGGSGNNAAAGGNIPAKPIMPLEDAPLQQLLKTYISTPTTRSFIIIHQQAAHERILYERYKAAAVGKQIPSQKSLFPTTLSLSAPDAILLSELLPDLNQLGYTIEPFGKDSYIIQGTPADTSHGDDKAALENLLEQFKNFTSEIRFSRRERLIRTMARQQAIKPNTALSEKEMRMLVNDLFACTQHNVTPGGDPTFIEFKPDYVEKLFGR
ncbi:MAG: DNA mismatch repair endonuclease MutL [Bacteroidetes bacterium]|nr:DNA mismatch repair endonuclease MutL [Bacteroidota bacterium]